MPRRTARRLSIALASGAATAGAASLVVGWVLGADAPWIPAGGALMAASTGACIALIGAAIARIAVASPGPGPGAPWMIAAALPVVLITVLDIAVITARGAEGLEAWLFGPHSRLASARMAPGTAIVLLLAVAAFLGAAAGQAGRGVFVASTTTGLLITYIALVGHAFEAKALGEVVFFAAMSLPTAACLAMLFVALAGLRPDWGWMAVLLDDARGSAAARRLLPVVLLGPPVIVLGALMAVEANLFDPNFRATLLTAAITLILAVAVLHSGKLDNRAEREIGATLERLRAVLDDRELLLAEVYHRVKNNLQQIIVLIAMEERRLADPEGRAALVAVAGRVRALAAVHELLVAAPMPSRIGLPDLVESLCALMGAGIGTGPARFRIMPETAGVTGTIHIERALPLGLIINELVTNAAKHAFADGAPGTVHVRLAPRPGGRVALEVADDGRAGEAEAAALRAGSSTGARILRSLAAQLRADLTIAGGAGLSVLVEFSPTGE